MKKLVDKFLDRLVHNPWYVVFAVMRRMPKLIPDSLFLRVMYRANLGLWPDLKNPRRFTEKLQWLKLHDRNPLYTTLVDKLAVKRYVAKKLGPEYVFKVLGEWDRVEDIDFNSLPDRFVLKCNHFGGGSVFVCKDKANFDFKNVRQELLRQVRTNIFWSTREWPYKNVVPKIFAEEYMEDDSGALRDYKFYCVDGVPQFVLVVNDRFGEHRYDGYDMEFKPFGRVSNAADPSSRTMECPEAFEEMVRIAKELSKGLRFIRIDLYEIHGRVYFGEFTFYPASGLNNRGSDEWDLDFGLTLNLRR